jgi:Fe2+ transport system protein FeoA
MILETKSQLIYVATVMSSRITPPLDALSGCANPAVCPLNQIRAGMAVRIKQLSAPPEVSHRLRELGFCEDQQIRLLSQQANVICQVCNVRLGISSQLAESILVEPMPAKAAS